MKKNIFSICMFLVLSISISSCNKDGSEDSKENNTIVGKWSLVSYEISNFENTGETIDDFAGETPRPTFEFKSNGICNINYLDDDQYPRVVGYKIEENKLVFDEVICWDTHDSFYFDISGKTLTLNRNDSYTDNSTSYIEKTSVKLIRI